MPDGVGKLPEWTATAGELPSERAGCASSTKGRENLCARVRVTCEENKIPFSLPYIAIALKELRWAFCEKM